MSPTADLATWLAAQRWYAGDRVPAVTAVERHQVTTGLALVLVTTDDGATYQLVQTDGRFDRMDLPKTATALGAFASAGQEAAGVRARWMGAKPGRGRGRLLGADQSNTSAVVGGTHVAKVLRRLQPGRNLEVEAGRHLAAVGGAPVAPLAGWWELADHGTALGVVHELVAGALDGWGLVVGALGADPGALLARLRDLGVTVARLHGALAQPSPEADLDFGRRPLDHRDLWALADELLADPLLPPAGHHVVARALQAVGDQTGAAIRTHGDLHLGQTLVDGDGWVIIDFEGEPARSPEDRARHRSPLRDVAGMLRSFSYAAAAHHRGGGRPLGAGWEPAARAAFLDGYLATVDPDLLPPSAVATRALLALHELEKVLYEVAYEQAHRPDWAAIPQAGLDRLVEEATCT